MIDTVVLVPRRSDNDGPRDRAWRWLNDWWGQTGLPVYVGTHDRGPFNRSKAINIAAHDVGSWDVAVIADADTFVPRSQLRQAIELARKSHRLVMAYDAWHALTESATARILCGDHDQIPDEHDVDHTLYGTCSSMVCMSRKLWDMVGGFDDGFIGWGFEDVAVRHACAMLTGHSLRIDGPLWHLWHPPALEATADHPLVKANEARFQRYERCETPRAMRALLARLTSER